MLKMFCLWPSALYRISLKKSGFFLLFGVSYIQRQTGGQFTHLFPPENGQIKKERKGYSAVGVFSCLRSFPFLKLFFRAALMRRYFVVLPNPPSLGAQAASSSVMPNGRKMPCIMPCPAAICSVLPSRESLVSLH